ncbi:MAG: acetyl-CoA carboxylase carboxyl transferase subunit alpha, partial [Actinomycetota bacterium]|nr:acetyl-CoA carboxylase carboxyl transferase subunit alpha [Actinomycetota bacterium]
IDGIVPEPPGGAHTDHDAASALLAESLETALGEIDGNEPKARRLARRDRFRGMGVFVTP